MAMTDDCCRWRRRTKSGGDCIRRVRRSASISLRRSYGALKAAVRVPGSSCERMFARNNPRGLVGKERDFALSSGDKALVVLDGRHRVFAAARAGTQRLPVFVLIETDS